MTLIVSSAKKFRNMLQKTLRPIFCLLYTGTCLVQGKEFCFGVNNEQYRCEMGYCCGETECCTYYYELWWFWLVWTLIIMLSCCCAYRHRRVKMRLQQEQRQREISLMAYQGASSSFISPPPLNLRFWTDCKLPDYEEVAGHPPTPPPPYSEAENPPTVPAALPVAAVVLEPPVEEEETGGERATDSLEAAGDVAGPSQSGRGEGQSGVPSGVDGESSEESGTRRRHVTGDSGIEVCVCRLDMDEEDMKGEEDVEEQVEDGSLRQGAGSNCCSECHSSQHKEWSSEHQPTSGSHAGGLA
ncbi:hypothetical protein MATL_G00062880 [Megalops atlanticus]|uniref:WW domain binding protein 1 n=1 Tax=Megalops atlanticus TaxID=7932 RepID=A0A9D3QCV8_MEGAT|nr:hypothetical protein MATL_G00062880 [Megalops atlanticus]